MPPVSMSKNKFLTSQLVEITKYIFGQGDHFICLESIKAGKG